MTYRITRLFLIFTLTLLTLSAAAQARAALPDFVDLAHEAGKSVVNINTESTVAPGRAMPNPWGGTPFEEFFGPFFRNQPQRERKAQSLGSGFIISKDGYIITNNHVVENADKVSVTLQDGGKDFPAEIVGTDPETDLALIRIKTDANLKPLPLGDSDKARVGQWVVAIGNPFGLDHTVTAGIISAKGRIIGAGPYDDFIQTDASINPGNSGGPLINLKGEVIGINTAIVASGQGIGFAVPSNLAKDVIAQLKKHGSVKRGLLGVTVQDVDENTAKALGLKNAEGALVASVMDDGPAAEAGLRAGDVIVSVNGRNVEDSRELTGMIGAMKPGERVRIRVFRKGDEKNLTVTLTERSPRPLAEAPGRSEKGETALGMNVRPLNKQEARALGVDGGVLVADVERGSTAAESGMRPGDVILEVNQTPVATPQELTKALETARDKAGAALVLVKRQGQNVFVSIPLQS